MITLVSTACQESLEERCEREAKNFSRKNCPAQIDEYTTMDSMTFDKSTHTLNYFYTLNGAADREGLQTDNIRSLLLQQIKNSTHLKAYMDAAYQFQYTYRSKQNPAIIRFSTTFTQKDYK